MIKGSYDSYGKGAGYHTFFTNFANPLKIGIVLQLKDKDKNVTSISESLGVEQSKVSHALAALKSCHIVEGKRVGKEMIYSLNKSTIVPMLQLINKHAHLYCNNNCCYLRRKDE